MHLLQSRNKDRYLTFQAVVKSGFSSSNVQVTSISARVRKTEREREGEIKRRGKREKYCS